MARPKIPVSRLIDEIDHPPQMRAKGIIIQEPSEKCLTTQHQDKRVSYKEKDKGKGKQKVVEQPASDDSDSRNISCRRTMKLQTKMKVHPLQSTHLLLRHILHLLLRHKLQKERV